MSAHARKELEAALAAPAVSERLDALRALCKATPPKPRAGVNLHIHTNESFSVFRSPTEAVWQAVLEGVAVLGINDHYTVAGHDEFRKACRVAHMPAAFSMEAVAMDRAAEADGVLLNDPGNPGRVYLCCKGITGTPAESSRAARNLSMMRAALEKRNRAMTEKLAAVFRERVGEDGPSWEDVVSLTPRGNTTERHVAKAAFMTLRKLAAARGTAENDAVAQLCGEPPPADDDAARQNFIRAKLLKAGGPCFIAESPDAFISMEEMRDMFLEFGAVPTYPILGNPVTEGERDVAALLDRLADMGFFAVELICRRNTRERVAEAIRAAKARWQPVFNGTEHNTPARQPMLDGLALDPEFLPWFEQSAFLLLGHQDEVANGRPGFLNDDGAPSIKDARERFEHFSAAGRRVWKRASPV